mmetsp:Transcript_102640/g.197056  ORF Transcript_102640/g.197056 Transcript_102640/m.197056 type:complete len:470 (+) Transcript_102640:79-1488(+)
MGCSASTRPESNSIAKQSRQTFHEKYRLGTKVGRGAFAQVRLATNMTTGQEVAVKIIDLQGAEKNSEEQVIQGNGNGAECGNVNNPRLVEFTATEAIINRKLGTHKHIVQMLDDPFPEGRISYIVMEKCDFSVWDKLESSPKVTEGMLARMFREMLLGIAYLHSKSIVHRDIKPDNFLFKTPAGGNQPAQLKLCDFGLSGTLQRKDELLRGIFGTPPFMSPEMLSGKGCNEKTDIWSMSITVYVLLLGQFPYTPRRRLSYSIRAAILEGRPPANFEVSSKLQHLGGPSSRAMAFLRGIFIRDMQNRLTAKKALGLPFLAESSMKLSDESTCFKPMIYEAKRCGAFEPKNLITEAEIDDMLNSLQSEHQGVGLRLSANTPDDHGGLKAMYIDEHQSPGIISNGGKSASWDSASTGMCGEQHSPAIISHVNKSASWDTASTGTGGMTASSNSQGDAKTFHTEGDLGRLEVH